MAFQVGDIIHLTEDFPRLEVVSGPSPMGSGKIALKTAQHWAEHRKDVYLVERPKG